MGRTEWVYDRRTRPSDNTAEDPVLLLTPPLMVTLASAAAAAAAAEAATAAAAAAALRMDEAEPEAEGEEAAGDSADRTSDMELDSDDQQAGVGVSAAPTSADSVHGQQQQPPPPPPPPMAHFPPQMPPESHFHPSHDQALLRVLDARNGLVMWGPRDVVLPTRSTSSVRPVWPHGWGLECGA